MYESIDLALVARNEGKGNQYPSKFQRDHYFEDDTMGNCKS